MRRHFSPWWWAIVWWAAPRLVAAAELGVEGEGECPVPAALARALRTLLPAWTVTDGAPVAGGIPVRVVDAGPRYRLRVGDVERDLGHPARACDDRAGAG